MNTPDTSFLNPKLNAGRLDVYIVRKSILNALVSHQAKFHGILLDVGCGQMPYKKLLTAKHSKVIEYIGLDLENNKIHKNHPDIIWQDGKIPLPDEYINSAISTEVLEHCFDPESIMKEIHRVLKPGGYLFLTVPFIWPLHEVPFDEYRYTPYSLHRHLIASGFKDIELKPLGGWDASLAQMLGLWARGRKMSKWKRKFISLLTIPLISFLFRMDQRVETHFNENSMITGIIGVARKL